MDDQNRQDEPDTAKPVPTWPCPSCHHPVTYPTGGNRAWCGDCGSPLAVGEDQAAEGDQEETTGS